MRILNTHAGIGGNRELWGDEHEITAVEFDPAIAAVYQQRFPNDTVIVGDAFGYVEKHFAEFDPQLGRHILDAALGVQHPEPEPVDALW